MNFRVINQQTLEQVKFLWDYCFDKADTPFYKWYFANYALKQNKILGGFNEDKLQTMVHLNPFVLEMSSGTEKMPYLVGVATDPVARGQHAISGLLQTAFTLAKATGSKAVLLMPINAGIYQPYGFSYIEERKHYKMPLNQLTLAYGDAGLSLERVDTAGACDVLSAVYAKAMSHYGAHIVRDERVWTNMLTVAAAEKLETVIVKEDGQPAGYVLYSRAEDTIVVQELLAINGRVQKKLLAYLRGFAGMFKTLEWMAAADDTTYLDWKNQRYAPRVAPFMMARVIDLPGVLQSLKVPPGYLETSLVLGVQDEFVPGNNLVLQLNISQKGIELRDTLKVPEITMDITAFTQLYFGAYSAEQLCLNDRIMAEDANKLQAFSRLFPAQKTYINEYF